MPVGRRFEAREEQRFWGIFDRYFQIDPSRGHGHHILMKKLVLVVTLSFSVSLVMATVAEADRRGRGRVRHVLKDRRHRSPRTNFRRNFRRRGVGVPLAFRHHPRHLHSRRYGFHPHRYRPFRYRGYGYWSPFTVFAPNYWTWPLRHHHHGVECYEGHEHDEPTDDIEGGQQVLEIGAGWRLYGEGKSYDALRVFAQQASRDEEDGVAKVGVALAAAETGDLARGVWSMRRALRIDPEGLRYVPIDRRVGERIRHLMVEYRRNPGSAEKRRDHAFMLSALHYLLDENDAARDELRLAVEFGDRTNSVNNLEKILRKRS